jgi:signal recognition particle subunit SRP54
VKVNDVNQLVDRFFEARKLMGQLGGSMGLPGARRSSKNAKGKKGKKGRTTKGRGPTAPKLPAGFPGGLGGLGGAGDAGGLPSGFGDLSRGLGELPPGTRLPDLSKLKLPKE